MSIIHHDRPSLSPRWGRLSFTIVCSMLLFIAMPLLGNIGDMSLLHSELWAQDLPETIPAEGPETKPCSSCHSEEAAAWQRSLHAEQENGSAGAACTDCHGEYVRGHPDEGMIPLVIDSSNCGDCHADTYDQWTHSLHAGEGVQCIGCHNAHDQELRLTDDKLCSSCHREAVDDPLHSAHWQSEVACTSCHLTGSPIQQSVASSDPLMAASLTTSHDFVTVSAAMCLDCHRNDVQTPASENGTLVQAKDGLAQPVQPSPELESKLQSVEKSNSFLAMLSTVNLGFGIGIGGILGILFVMVVATISKRSDKA